MTTLDVDFCRAQFDPFTDPALSSWAYFENAGGSFAPRIVAERLQRFYSSMKMQPYYAHAPSQRLGEGMDDSIRRLANAVNASSDEITLASSSSQNVYVLAQAFGAQLEPGDEIILSAQDHETNIGAWARLEQQGATIRWWLPDTELGLLDLADLDALLSPRTKLVCVTHCSNVAGTINPVEDIVARCHTAGARVVLDGVAHAPHGLPDVAGTGADAYFFSLYKTYSVHQGLLYVRRDFAATLAHQGHFFNADLPRKQLDSSGPDHAAHYASAGMLDYFRAVYEHQLGEKPADDRACVRKVGQWLAEQEQVLLTPIMDYLLARDDVRVIGAPSNERRVRVPTIGFSIDGVSPATIAQQLAAAQIGMGNGNFYSWRLMERLGIDPQVGVARVSLLHYNTLDEVDRLIAALEKIRA